MTAKNFSDGIYKECIMDQLQLYENLLENIANATDPIWIDIINIYKKLNDREK